PLRAGGQVAAHPADVGLQRGIVHQAELLHDLRIGLAAHLDLLGFAVEIQLRLACRRVRGAAGERGNGQRRGAGEGAGAAAAPEPPDRIASEVSHHVPRIAFPATDAQMTRAAPPQGPRPQATALTGSSSTMRPSCTRTMRRVRRARALSWVISTNVRP